ncbi:MAG: hypothetical protein RJA36_2907 [Pseudomonadota bacterium]
MAQKYGTSPPPPSGKRPAAPPPPPRPRGTALGAAWRNAYLDPPAAVGVYWCAYENGGCWLGYFVGGKWQGDDQHAGDDMGRIEFYLDLPEHPFKAERSKAWHER